MPMPALLEDPGTDVGRGRASRHLRSACRTGTVMRQPQTVTRTTARSLRRRRRLPTRAVAATAALAVSMGVGTAAASPDAGARRPGPATLGVATAAPVVGTVDVPRHITV